MGSDHSVPAEGEITDGRHGARDGHASRQASSSTRSCASNDDYPCRSFRMVGMRPAVDIADELLAKASRLAGPMDRTAILSEGVKALIERESAKRLAWPGGTQPSIKTAPRRRGSVLLRC
jgi:hypothetical protein